MSERKPLAFMSYVHTVDTHDRGRLTSFRERLEKEVRVRGGEEFVIFQDIEDIVWGQQWQDRIRKSLDEVYFLIPIITPAFFKSDACRTELTIFLEREQRLGRRDLVLPIHYIEVHELADPRCCTDSLMREISRRQLEDWRELRLQPFSSERVDQAIAKLASMLAGILRERQLSIGSEPGWLPPGRDRTTLIVNQAREVGSGQYRSISEALRDAKEGGPNRH